MHSLGLYYSLLCAWTVQLVHPKIPSIDGIQDVICRSIPGLNERQIELCKQVPKAISILTEAEERFKKECKWQFRKELWNCTGLSRPIFSVPNLKDTKESAFAYGLSSALTVHQITKGCSSGALTPACGCDVSKNGLKTVQGWKWGSCSDNVSYGITYAQNFLDAREIEDTDNNIHEEVSMAEVRLHNNAVGRRVVADGMKVACKCHGFSGSCSVKTCWKELPSLYEIGDSMKVLYDRAIRVEVQVSRGGGLPLMHYYNEDQDTYLIPSQSELVYLDDSPRYCASNANFTDKRLCMPNSSLSSHQFEDTSMGEFYPPCETFCCNGEFEAVHKTEESTCNCLYLLQHQYRVQQFHVLNFCIRFCVLFSV